MNLLIQTNNIWLYLGIFSIFLLSKFIIKKKKTQQVQFPQLFVYTDMNIYINSKYTFFFLGKLYVHTEFVLACLNHKQKLTRPCTMDEMDFGKTAHQLHSSDLWDVKMRKRS